MIVYLIVAVAAFIIGVIAHKFYVARLKPKIDSTINDVAGKIKG